MIGFNEWLHFNDGERYEGLREEYFEGGGEPGNFLEWAEEKYASQLKTVADRRSAQRSSKHPSDGIHLNVDLFSLELYSFREATEELATARGQVDQVKGDGYSQEVRERVQRHFASTVERRDKSAILLADLVSVLVIAADPQSK